MTTVIWQADPGSSHPLPARRRVIVEAGSWHVHTQPHVWSPPTDLYETQADYIVRVEIAGMRRQDFSVTLDDEVLTIRATRADAHERRSYHQMEVRFGEFSSFVTIPGPVDTGAALAEYEDGFLTVTLPKTGSKRA